MRQDVAEGTRVVQSIDFKPPGGKLGAMAGGMIARQIAGELSKSLKRQRETLEREYGATRGSGTAG